MNLVLVETVTIRKPLQWSETGTEGVGQPWKTHIRTSELSQVGHLVLQAPLAASVPQNSLELGKGSGACGIELLREGERAEPGAELQEQGPAHLLRT